MISPLTLTPGGPPTSGLLNKCSPAVLAAVGRRLVAAAGGQGFVVCGRRPQALPVLGRLRANLAERLLADLKDRPHRLKKNTFC